MRSTERHNQIFYFVFWVLFFYSFPALAIHTLFLLIYSSVYDTHFSQITSYCLFRFRFLLYVPFLILYLLVLFSIRLKNLSFIAFRRYYLYTSCKGHINRVFQKQSMQEIFKSSENNNFSHMFKEISLIKNRKSSEPKFDPCGTPDDELNTDDETPRYSTCNLRSNRYEENKSSFQIFNPVLLNSTNLT